MNMVLNAFATTAEDKRGGRYGNQSVRNSIFDQVSGSLHSSSPTWKEGRPPVCCVLLTTAVVQAAGEDKENEEGTWRKKGRERSRGRQKGAEGKCRREARGAGKECRLRARRRGGRQRQILIGSNRSGC